MAAPKITPAPGRPVRRERPYLWVTWLAKLLGATDPCLWAGWFKAHYQYTKYEKDAEHLQAWNRDHSMLMQRKREALERAGWSVAVEDANKFTVKGEVADIGGKPDLIARQDDQVLIVDGKTGRERDADTWQVLFYLYALPLVRPDLTGKELSGVVHYKQRGDRVLTPPSIDQIDFMSDRIRLLAADQAPARAPLKWNCAKCDIHPKDCPARVTEDDGGAVGRSAHF